MIFRKLTVPLLGGALVLAVAVGSWMSRTPESPREVQEQPRAIETIESSGKILGLAVGSSMQEAREKLDPLRVPVVYTPDQKELSGRRIYWKLKETEYDWVMAWANGEGRITRVRAVLRPENLKPFGEIGNPAAAASIDQNRAKWNLRRPDGPYFRLIAQGAEQRANSVYMFSLELPGEQQGTSEESEEED